MKNTPKKILHVITGLENGGAETMLVKLLESQSAKNLDRVVVSLRDEGVMGKKIRDLGVPLYCCDMFFGWRLFLGPIKLFGIFRRFKPEIVQTWLYHADFFGGLVAKLAGIKSVYWNVRHNNLDEDKNKKQILLFVKLNSILSRWIPNAIVCNSKDSVKVHVKQGYIKEKFVVIPNGFDIEKYQKSDSSKNIILKELSLRENILLVGLVARYDPQKNHLGFIEAASKIILEISNTHILLIGSGINMENTVLIDKIKRYPHLENKIHLLGRREDMSLITAALDVAVCASWGESFPNSVGEAMASEVPCVVTNVGDCAEIVGDSGWVVLPGDMESLANCVIEALALSVKERSDRGRLARDIVKERYSIAEVLKEYENLYINYSS